MVVNDELRVHPGLALHFGMLKIGIAKVARVERAKTAQQAIRNQFDAMARRNSLQAVQGRRLPQTSLNLVGNVRPEGIFRLARNATIQNDSPFLLLRRREAQALEGNRHLHDEALLGYFAARVPYRIE